MSLKMKYFVLKPSGTDKFAIASRKAMIKYADHIMANAENDDDKEFAMEIHRWVGDEFAKAAPPNLVGSDERGQY